MNANNSIIGDSTNDKYKKATKTITTTTKMILSSHDFIVSSLDNIDNTPLTSSSFCDATSTLPIPMNNDGRVGIICIKKEESITKYNSHIQCNNNVPTSSTQFSTNNNNNINEKYCYHMIIHFDINETILIGDEAGGDTKEQCINKVLAKSAYVRIPSNNDDNNNEFNDNKIIEYHDDDNILLSKYTTSCQPTHWWNGMPIVTQEQQSEEKQDIQQKSYITNSHNNNIVPPLYTGWIWPKDCCPYYRTSYKDNGPTFTDHNHHGKIYAPIYDLIHEQIMTNMKIESTPTEKTKTLHGNHHQQEGKDHQQEEYPSILSCMLPSFFDTLAILFPSENKQNEQNHDNNNENNDNDNIDIGRTKISIVLRTFGSDLSGVAQCITLFAKGQHPSYPNYCNAKLIMTTSDNSPHLSLLRKGRWQERKEIPQKCKVKTTNSNHRKDMNQQGDNNNRLDSDDDQYDYTLMDDNGNIVAENDESIIEWIHSNTICGIQDDYQFWKKNNYQPWSGKPIWIINNKLQEKDEHIKTDDYYYHHLLFDDNM